jgi:hypothetical protein
MSLLWPNLVKGRMDLFIVKVKLQARAKKIV